MGTLKSIIMIVVVVLLLLFGIKQQIDINNLEKYIEELEGEVVYWNRRVEELESEVELSDEESLEKEAREEFYDPDATHFTNDYSN